MVNIKMNFKTLEIQIEGHANTAPKGEDLVCCAVSTLSEALSVYLETMLHRGMLIDLKEEVTSGHVYLNPQPYSWAMNTIRAGIEVIRLGFMSVANTYNEYIKYEEDE